MLGDKTVLEHVITACEESRYYAERETRKNLSVVLALLVPEGDPLVRYESRLPVVAGSEHNVLSRYAKARDRFNPDFIVRVTADCPLLPPFVITKHIKVATFSDLDYVSNVDPRYRTEVDGWDCEIISRALFEWLYNEAISPYDTEHVTTLARSHPPSWARVGHVLGHLDRSDMKLSIDTVEDYERVKEHYEKIQNKILSAKTGRQKCGVYRC